MGDKCILSVIQSATIDTMLNWSTGRFWSKNIGLNLIMCEQTLTHLVPIYRKTCFFLCTRTVKLLYYFAYEGVDCWDSDWVRDKGRWTEEDKDNRAQ